MHKTHIFDQKILQKLFLPTYQPYFFQTETVIGNKQYCWLILCFYDVMTMSLFAPLVTWALEAGSSGISGSALIVCTHTPALRLGITCAINNRKLTGGVGQGLTQPGVRESSCLPNTDFRQNDTQLYYIRSSVFVESKKNISKVSLIQNNRYIKWSCRKATLILLHVKYLGSIW